MEKNKVMRMVIATLILAAIYQDVRAAKPVPANQTTAAKRTQLVKTSKDTQTVAVGKQKIAQQKAEFATRQPEAKQADAESAYHSGSAKKFTGEIANTHEMLANDYAVLAKTLRDPNATQAQVNKAAAAIQPLLHSLDNALQAFVIKQKKSKTAQAQMDEEMAEEAEIQKELARRW